MDTVTTKHKIHNDERCQVCLLNSYQRLMNKFTFHTTQRESFMVYYREVIGNSLLKSSPEKQRELNRMFCKLANNTDLYYEEKVLSNKVAFELYHKWKPKYVAFQYSYLHLMTPILKSVIPVGSCPMVLPFPLKQYLKFESPNLFVRFVFEPTFLKQLNCG